MTYEEAMQMILPGRYRHFKGNEYEVIGIARHSETMEPMVVYRALYGGSGIGKTAEKLEPYMKDARITDAKRVSSVGELTSWLN